MSIRWIRNVTIEGEETTLEIQVGYKRIGDRCYTRIGTDLEEYFPGVNGNRDDVVRQAIDILQRKLIEKSVTYPDGRLYDWQ